MHKSFEAKTGGRQQSGARTCVEQRRGPGLPDRGPGARMGSFRDRSESGGASLARSRATCERPTGSTLLTCKDRATRGVGREAAGEGTRIRGWPGTTRRASLVISVKTNSELARHNRSSLRPHHASDGIYVGPGVPDDFEYWHKAALLSFTDHPNRSIKLIW